MRKNRLLAVLAAAAVVATLSAAVPAEGKDKPGDNGPLVIGHRGAPGYRPEHTMTGYELAIEMGADYIEPDLVSTKDGVLVDRHEPDITGTTDVASHPEFASRKTTKVIDGVSVTGWFTDDFTLAELKTLGTVERLPAIRQHNTIFNSRDTVPTLQEDIDLVARLGKKYHREIGIIPETKHPSYFRAEGLGMEERLVAILHAAKLDGRNDPTIIQSFEVGNLQYLHTITKTKLVQLTGATGQPFDFTLKHDPRTYADITSAAGLKEVAKYAQLIGPDKAQIIPRDASNHLLAPTSLVRDAHAAGLKLTPYTFRAENNFLPADFQHGTNPADYGDAIAEDVTFLKTGIDGFFTDNPDIGVLARADWQKLGSPTAA